MTLVQTINRVLKSNNFQTIVWIVSAGAVLGAFLVSTRPSSMSFPTWSGLAAFYAVVLAFSATYYWRNRTTKEAIPLFMGFVAAILSFLIILGFRPHEIIFV